jgi:hypothetical protein
MSKGGISPSGRAARWLFWRVPRRATEYTVAGYMATAQEVGRRWITIVVFGLWLWFLRWVAEHVVRTEATLAVTAVLLLLWFWRVVSLVQWTIDLKVAAARQRAATRELFQTVQQLPGQIQQAVASRTQGGSYTMPNLLRHHDPEYETQRQAAREQADRSRAWLPSEQQDMPLGDRHDPVFPMPKWMRRRRPKDGDQ